MKEILGKYNYQIVLILVSFILYGNTLKNGYALDDEFVTGPKNIVSKGFKALPKVFKVFHVVDESGNTYEYRPIVKATFALEYGLWGENLVLSHLVNVILYALCLLVLFKLLQSIFKEVSVFILFASVFIFAFLPVHAEVVASLKNRDVLLCFLFSFSGFLYLIRFIEKKNYLFLLIAALFFGLAVLSKFDFIPMLAIVPLVLFKRFDVNLKRVLGIVIVFAAAYYIYRLTKLTMLDRTVIKGVRVFQYFENPLFFEKDIMVRLSAGFNSLGFYLKMLFMPTDMVCYYGYNALDVFSFTSLYALLGAIGGGWMMYEFVNRFKKPDLLWYGIVFFGFSISMYLNVVVPAAGIVADRFMFFASVGFSMMLAYYLFIFKNENRKVNSQKDLKVYQKAIPLILMIVFGFQVLNRNKEWNNKLGLFETDVKKRPESVKLALLTSAQVITSLNDGSNSIPENQKLSKIRLSEKVLANAIKTDSSCAGCYNNIAYLLLTYERDPGSALPYLRLGYKRDSTKKELACNIGIAYLRLGQMDKSKPYLLKAIDLDKKKDFLVPFEVLQDLFKRTNPAEGIQFFNKKMEEGYHPEFMNVMLGKTFFEVGDTLNSIKSYKAALSINPDNKSVSDFVTQLEIKYYKNQIR